MPALRDVASEKLQKLTAEGRVRLLREAVREEGCYINRDGKRLLSFTCNDYLGLSQHPRVKNASIDAINLYGASAGASRLVTGSHPLYGEFETKLAAWKGTQAALVFGSGYLANIGIIPALMGKDDLVLSDKLAHACLIDGARLSSAKFLRFAHNNVQDCERLLATYRSQYRNTLIITDEVFSMDGDLAPIAELKALCKKYDAWLMADGAHALLPSAVKTDIAMGTLSKAFGTYGGYVAGDKALIDLIASTARSLVFSTGLPPATIAAANAALSILLEDNTLASLPLAKARLFTGALGLKDAESSIVPLILKTEERALAASATLETAGYAVAAIRPPTVPEGTSRLRFTFCALHRDEDILSLAEFIKSQGWI